MQNEVQGDKPRQQGDDGYQRQKGAPGTKSIGDPLVWPFRTASLARVVAKAGQSSVLVPG